MNEQPPLLVRPRLVVDAVQDAQVPRESGALGRVPSQVPAHGVGLGRRHDPHLPLDGVLGSDEEPAHRATQDLARPRSVGRTGRHDARVPSSVGTFLV